MIPHRFAPSTFWFILSGLMSLIVSGTATARAAGLGSDFPGLWPSAFATSWAVAFLTVLVVAPLARHLVARLTAPPR